MVYDEIKVDYEWCIIQYFIVFCFFTYFNFSHFKILIQVISLIYMFFKLTHS